MNLNQFNAVAASVAEEFLATGLDNHHFFTWAIHKQNKMYDLPVATEPTVSALNEPVSKRLQGFINTLNKEISEGYEILALAKLYEGLSSANDAQVRILSDESAMAESLIAHGLDQETANSLAKSFRDFSTNTVRDQTLSHLQVLERFILVAMADWHADLAVYNRSEALKYGIPLESVQAVVMNSNFTKLGADGQPLKDANGKFLKGPGFIPPENHIHALMFESESLIEEGTQLVTESEKVESFVLPLLYPVMNEVIDAVDSAAATEAELDEIYSTGDDYEDLE